MLITYKITFFYNIKFTILYRHEQWTTAEYYKQADESQRRQQELKIKSESLERRRSCLQNLMKEEKYAYEREIEGIIQ